MIGDIRSALSGFTAAGRDREVLTLRDGRLDAKLPPTRFESFCAAMLGVWGLQKLFNSPKYHGECERFEAGARAFTQMLAERLRSRCGDEHANPALWRGELATRLVRTGRASVGEVGALMRQAKVLRREQRHFNGQIMRQVAAGRQMDAALTRAGAQANKRERALLETILWVRAAQHLAYDQRVLQPKEQRVLCDEAVEALQGLQQRADKGQALSPIEMAIASYAPELNKLSDAERILVVRHMTEELGLDKDVADTQPIPSPPVLHQALRNAMEELESVRQLTIGLLPEKAVLANAKNVSSDQEFQEFRNAVQSIALLPWFKFLFVGGVETQAVDDIALCHIASCPGGREYLEKIGELNKIEQCSLNLFKNLKPHVRRELLQNPILLNPLGVALKLKLGPEISDLQLPLSAECCGNNEGTLSGYAARMLMKSFVPAQEGEKTILEILTDGPLTLETFALLCKCTLDSDSAGELSPEDLAKVADAMRRENSIELECPENKAKILSKAKHHQDAAILWEKVAKFHEQAEHYDRAAHAFICRGHALAHVGNAVAAAQSYSAAKAAAIKAGDSQLEIEARKLTANAYHKTEEFAEAAQEWEALAGMFEISKHHEKAAMAFRDASDACRAAGLGEKAIHARQEWRRCREIAMRTARPEVRPVHVPESFHDGGKVKIDKLKTGIEDELNNQLAQHALESIHSSFRNDLGRLNILITDNRKKSRQAPFLTSDASARSEIPSRDRALSTGVVKKSIAQTEPPARKRTTSVSEAGREAATVAFKDASVASFVKLIGNSELAHNLTALVHQGLYVRALLLATNSLRVPDTQPNERWDVQGQSQEDVQIELQSDGSVDITVKYWCNASSMMCSQSDRDPIRLGKGSYLAASYKFTVRKKEGNFRAELIDDLSFSYKLTLKRPSGNPSLLTSLSRVSAKDHLSAGELFKTYHLAVLNEEAKIRGKDGQIKFDPVKHNADLNRRMSDMAAQLSLDEARKAYERAMAGPGAGRALLFTLKVIAESAMTTAMNEKVNAKGEFEEDAKKSHVISVMANDLVSDVSEALLALANRGGILDQIVDDDLKALDKSVKSFANIQMSVDNRGLGEALQSAQIHMAPEDFRKLRQNLEDTAAQIFTHHEMRANSEVVATDTSS